MGAGTDSAAGAVADKVLRTSRTSVALPGYLGGSVGKIGVKWIAGFPDDVSAGKPRASAVLLLNDYATGRPVACLEAAGISAARTAASAALIDGTIGAVLRGEVELHPGKPTSFSPFGLGVLDIAVGAFVLEKAREAGTAIVVENFVGEEIRW
ncbi:hypothetical protein [Amycolatopsis sp. CA-126428]|uniref:hypothetical protein n=1 Tax=Amycolatopsis sp. CA-126428 TaxID=2073158 RepID=UPI003511904E